MIVPSMLNSMTACDSLIAAACANASRAAVLFRHENIFKLLFKLREAGAKFLAANAANQPVPEER